jgi:hypothetical protein
MDNVAYNELSLKKAHQVKTLVDIGLKSVSGAKKLHLNSSLLFSRLVMIANRSQNMEPYFKYELTAVPTALFRLTETVQMPLIMFMLLTVVGFYTKLSGMRVVSFQTSCKAMSTTLTVVGFYTKLSGMRVVSFRTSCKAISTTLVVILVRLQLLCLMVI